jgi:hypothetical protein
MTTYHGSHRLATIVVLAPVSDDNLESARAVKALCRFVGAIRGERGKDFRDSDLDRVGG